jgi:hypothetical protein
LREAAIRAFEENRHGRTASPAETREIAEDPLKYYALMIYPRCSVYGYRTPSWRAEATPSPNYSRYHLECEGKDFVLRDARRDRTFGDLHIKNKDLQSKWANAEHRLILI